MQEPYRKGSSDSILTSSLAGVIVRWHLKRRTEALVGGVIELREVAVQDADSLSSRRKAIRQPRYTRVAVRSCVVVRARARQGNNMHENREISSTPWSDDQGRSAKAINHNADVYVLEKSHCAVVPVNQ